MFGIIVGLRRSAPCLKGRGPRSGEGIQLKILQITLKPNGNYQIKLPSILYILDIKSSDMYNISEVFYMLNINDIRMRDSFIVADGGVYYLYGTIGEQSGEKNLYVFKSRDLENFEEAILRPKVVGLKTGRVYDLAKDLSCASIIVEHNAKSTNRITFFIRFIFKCVRVVQF